MTRRNDVRQGLTCCDETTSSPLLGTLLDHLNDGQDLLEMIQQRAEQWAASGLVTTSKTLANIISSCHTLSLGKSVTGMTSMRVA
jgi:hypothetical protein